MNIVELKNVSFSYTHQQERALDGVNLELAPGKLYGVVGRNAAGKSTLASLMRGLIPYFHSGDLDGEVLLWGRSLEEWSPAELSRRIGYVFQNPFTQISGVRETVFEEIAFGLENLGCTREEIVDRVLQVAERMDLLPLLEKDPNGLSGGQRQKVAFAAVIAMDADFIVIDEPTSQLDPESSEEVFRIIAQLKERGKTLVLVEHKVDLLAEYVDELIVMEAGRVTAAGPSREVFASQELVDADVPRPEVTQLAFALREAGVAVDPLPITCEQALDAFAWVGGSVSGGSAADAAGTAGTKGTAVKGEGDN